jgi:oligopeptide transport system ATP-binding protein
MYSNVEVNNLVRFENLVKHFPVPRNSALSKQGAVIRAVDDVSLKIFKGETLGLIGETGSGKSTLAKCINQSTQPTSGRVFFKGNDVAAMEEGLLGKMIQMVFHDPMAYLNPKKTIRESIGGNLRMTGNIKSKEITEKIGEMLSEVGVNPAVIDLYPQQVSAGERQLVYIAKCFSNFPMFMVFDDPLFSFDITIQSRILNQMVDRQNKSGMGYLLISHDLSIIQHMSNRVAVMKQGIIIEIGEREDVLRYPMHPYTMALLSAMPIANPQAAAAQKRIILSGDTPSQLFPPSGCRFRTQCPIATTICAEEKPELKEHSPGHFAACHKI